MYWSLSHTDNTLASIVADHVCGIDIAEIAPRDDVLLDVHKDREYTLL